MISVPLIFIGSYLIGSIPLGLILGKILKGIDIRNYGSGKIGATNVLRTLGPAPAAITFIFDVAKGLIVVYIAKELGGTVYSQVVAASAATIGHNWSIFIRFTGGRGVTVGVGGLLAMAPLWGAAALLIGVVTIAITRYVSLGSLIGAGSAFLILLITALQGAEPWEYFGYAAAMVTLIYYAHRDNLVRLIRGTEPKVGQGGKPITKNPNDRGDRL